MPESKTKICTRCFLNKDFSMFSKDSSRVDGKTKWCKSCCKIYTKRYRENNKEKIKNKNKLFYEKNKKLIKQKNSENYFLNKEEILKRNKEYSVKNADFIKKRMAQYVKNNKSYYAERNMKRYTEKKKRVPSWLTTDDFWMIKEIYDLAKKRTELTGVKHHVDHIVPLHGKTVSGLHVPQNLQVLEQIQNIRKKNKYDDWSDYAE